MTHHWQQTGLPTYTDIIATATSKTDSLDSKISTYELLTQFPETLTLTFNSMYQGFQLLLSTWHLQLIPSKQSHLYVDYEALTLTTELQYFLPFFSFLDRLFLRLGIWERDFLEIQWRHCCTVTLGLQHGLRDMGFIQEAWTLDMPAFGWDIVAQKFIKERAGLSVERTPQLAGSSAKLGLPSSLSPLLNWGKFPPETCF